MTSSTPPPGTSIPFGSEPPVTSPASVPRRRLRPLVGIGIAGLALAAFWLLIGRNLAAQYQQFLEESRAAEDNVPIGYLGLNPRRSYNDRAAVFLVKQEGRTTLFAAKNGDGKPDDVYDVTEASIDMNALEGGFGRDSIPGIDYPILETSRGVRGKKLRMRQEVFGLELDGEPRAYPRDLLEKIEMVNDGHGKDALLIVYDRGRAVVSAFRREVDGATVSFGSTGYSRSKQPVLYDRKTRSVWALEGDAFLCVAGAWKGRSLLPFQRVEPTPWGDWLGRHPDTKVLVGNDRSQPIPIE